MYKGKTIVIVGLVNLFWLILSWLGLRKTEGKFWKVFRNCLLIDIIVRVVSGYYLVGNNVGYDEGNQKYISRNDG